MSIGALVAGLRNRLQVAVSSSASTPFGRLEDVFQSDHYVRHNQRRQEHLASLQTADLAG